jgi:hypothetical protein
MTPRYDKPVRELMKDAASALEITTDRSVNRRDIVAWFERQITLDPPIPPTHRRAASRSGV